MMHVEISDAFFKLPVVQEEAALTGAFLQLRDDDKTQHTRP